jgi:hypothetical protein
MNIQLDGNELEPTVVEYVHEKYHQGAINGMDICLRK